MLIAQISDPHLTRPGTLYHGLFDGAACLRAALTQIAELDPRPDLLLLTGDLAEDGHPETYALARQILAACPVPHCLMPGNHDDRPAFRTAFGGPAEGPLHRVQEGPLRVICLDVTVPGDHHGLFDADAERWLDATLSAAPDQPSLIALHQPPFETGMAFIDAYRCFGEDRFSRLIGSHPQVQAVVCGHVHRFVARWLGGTIALTAPSLTSAIALRLAPGASPASLAEPPGFLLHDWQDGRGLVTHLVPVGRFPGPYDFF